MARVAVVGNATKDVVETGLLASRQPGGTLLYASLALDRLGHDVHPIGYAPLTAYLALRRAGVSTRDVSLALRPTKFKNRYTDGVREQRARPGPGEAIASGDELAGYEAVLLGPVLGEIPLDVELPDETVTFLDVQGAVRRLGDRDLWGWQEVHARPPEGDLPEVDVVRGSLGDLEAWFSTDDPETAARRLRSHTDAMAVVTDGPNPVCGHDGDLHRVYPDPIETQDPTGSGDVFDAALLHALVSYEPLEEALSFACGAARAFLARPEGVSPARFPTPEEARGRAPN